MRQKGGLPGHPPRNPRSRIPPQFSACPPPAPPHPSPSPSTLARSTASTAASKTPLSQSSTYPLYLIHSSLSEHPSCANSLALYASSRYDPGICLLPAGLATRPRGAKLQSKHDDDKHTIVPQRRAALLVRFVPFGDHEDIHDHQRDDIEKTDATESHEHRRRAIIERIIRLRHPAADIRKDERDPEYTLQNTTDQHVYLCVCSRVLFVLVVLDSFLRLRMLDPILLSRDRIRALVG